MRKGIVYCFTVLFLAIFLFCWHQMPPAADETTMEESPPFWVEASAGEQERVTAWQKEDGQYVLFLPDFFRDTEVTLRLAQDVHLEIDGIPVTDGMPCPEWMPGQICSVTVSREKSHIQTTLTIGGASALPAMFVDTRSGNMTHIHRSKGNEEAGTMRLYDEKGSLDFSGNLESIKGRGNATWEQEKKPYSLKLVAEGDLLGMGAAENWILLANAMDPAAIRNKLVMDFAAEAGLAYTPRGEWVELYLNGSYAGVYLLSERNEVHEARVDIGGAGSFLVSIEKIDRLDPKEFRFVITQGEVPLRIHDSTVSAEELLDLWQTVENALTAEDGIDPVTGTHWQTLIDVDSWARKYLIEEIFGNLDAGFISQFFYREAGGKICAGPVWDYDMAAGNRRTWQIDTPNMLYAGRAHLIDPEDRPWYYGLSKKAEFWETLRALYQNEFRPQLEQLLTREIPAQTQRLSGPLERNGIRWQTEDPAAAAEELRAYMQERMAFLDSLWLEDTRYCHVLVQIQEHVMACYALLPGQTLPEREVPYGTETIVYTGWYDADTGEPFDFSQPITQNKRIYLHQEDHSLGGEAQKSLLRALLTYTPGAVLLLLLAILLARHRYIKERTEKNGDERRKTEKIPS